MSKPEDKQGNIEERLAVYQKGNFNVLLPTKQILEVSEYFKPVLEEVQLSIEAGDAYPQEMAWKPKDCKKWGLSKNGLIKLMQCAGVILDATQSKPLKHERDWVVFQMVGALKKADGSMFPMIGTYELDLQVVEDEIRQTKRSQADKMDQKVGQDAPPWGKAQGHERDLAMDRWIEDKVTQEMMRKRRFKLGLAETGAMLRMIRAILTIKGTYSTEELARPFVVPKIVFQPNMADPEIRRALLQTAMASLSSAFGRVPDVSTALHLPLASSGDDEPYGLPSATEVEVVHERAIESGNRQPFKDDDDPAAAEQQLGKSPREVVKIMTIDDYDRVEAQGDRDLTIRSIQDLQLRNPTGNGSHAGAASPIRPCSPNHSYSS